MKMRIPDANVTRFAAVVAASLTRATTRSASGDTLSITGSAVTPEFHFYSVTNIDVAATPSPSQTNVISQYDYVYDAADRRISVAKSGTAFDHADTIAYGYNNRSELTNVVTESFRDL